MKFALPKRIAEKIYQRRKEYRTEVDKLKSLSATWIIAQKVCDDFPMLKSYGQRISPTLGYDRVDIPVSVDKLVELLAIRRALSALTGKAGKRTEFAENRMFYYRYGDIDLNVQFEQEGTCHYVQIGTKETPIYKLKCGEDQEAVQPQTEGGPDVQTQTEGATNG